VLKRAAQRRGLESPVVVTFNPFVAAYSRLGWCRRVVYYARDDWASFARNDGLRGALIEAQTRIRTNGTVVCAVSRELADRVAGAGGGFVIQNAVDPETWAAIRPTPEALRALPRPLAAYAGTVDDRLDVAAVRSLARSGVLASIAIIGLVTDQSVASELASEPNVHVVGPMIQRELVGALMAADLCLLLHAVTDVTTAMSPLKLYEYLASGAPVLATDLPPIRGVDDRIVLTDGSDYAAAAKSALAKGKLAETERQAVVRANSWERRHELLINVMSSTD
jgi:glycosyltransferase involved in cell wall biosynthesis